LAGNTLLHRAKVWGIGQNDPKTSNKNKHLLGGHFYAPNYVFRAIVREIISFRLACAGTQEKRQEGKTEGKKVTRNIFFTYA